MISIFSHTAESFSHSVAFHLKGKGRFHAELIYKAWMREAQLYQEEGNAQKIISKIHEMCNRTIPEIFSCKKEEGTKKVVLKTFDSLFFEMVLLPMQAGWTLCISSQVGCKIGCSFCETAKMGLIRSLSVEEIVSQLFIAKHHFQIEVRNIVFMGMGEPFDNYESVMKAVEIFTDMNGFALGPRHITISTSGLADKIVQFSKEAHPALNLAISVNAPTNEKREKLMIITKSFDMNSLHEAMQIYLAHPRREILIEYVLIDGKNDSLQDADSLALYLKELRVKINIIPYNAQKRGLYKAPSKDKVNLFAQRLKDHGFFVLIRDTKGERIMAACGQLNSKNSLAFSEKEVQ